MNKPWPAAAAHKQDVKPTSVKTFISALRNQRGAFDVASITIGVVLLGVLVGGILVTLNGIIPWAQDGQAKDNLSAVSTAESAHLGTDGGFTDLTGLQASKNLPTAADKVDVQAGGASDCYVAVAKSDSGALFYSSDKTIEPRKLDPSVTSTSGSTPLPCVSGDQIQAMADNTGGYEASTHEGTGSGDGTAASPGFAEEEEATGTAASGTSNATTDSVTVEDENVIVGFSSTGTTTASASGDMMQLASATSIALPYSAKITCFDPVRNKATTWEANGTHSFAENTTSTMRLLGCAPGSRVIAVKFQAIDSSYKDGKGKGFVWRGAGDYKQAAWLSRGLTADNAGGWCIENQGNASTVGNPLFMANCAAGKAQRWQWTGDGEIRQSSQTYKCAGVSADRLVLTDCAAAPGLAFEAVPFQGENPGKDLFQIVDKASGRCVGAPGGTRSNVQLVTSACDGNPSQGWGLPGLAKGLTPELKQPEAVIPPPPEPTTPTPNSDAVGMEIIAPTLQGWSTVYWPSRATTEMTSGSMMFALQVKSTKPASDYKVEWSGASLNATGIKVPTATSASTSSGQPLFYGTVTAASGGFKTGTGYVTATVTDIGTGNKSVKTWTITVNPAAVVSPTSMQGWPTVYWPNRATTEMTSGGIMFAMAINHAKDGDFKVEWSGGSAVNGAPGAGSLSVQSTQGVFYSTITPGTGGWKKGTDTVTAKITHLATGTVLTKTWTITVNPAAIVAPTAQGWSTVYWPNRATTEMTSGGVMFAMGINHAKAGDFTIEWSGGSAVNASPGAGLVSVQSDQGMFYSTITPGTGGWKAGTDTITVKATHAATGTVLTKTWTITVNPAAIVAPTAQGWSTVYWPNRATTEMTSGGVMFAMGINHAKAGDFTIEWSGGSAVNASPGAGLVSVQSDQGMFYSTITPGTGGWKAGTDTITVKATHAATGTVLTKTWTITVNPAAIVAPTLQGWAASRWIDRTVAIGSTAGPIFAFGINNAKAADFTVEWSGGAAVNAATPAAGVYSDQGSQGLYYTTITPGTGGFSAGSETITAKVTHVATGTVLTKTWKLTVG